MSVPFLGDYDTTETVNISLNTFTSDDPSASVTITDLVAGDVEIHKDGSTTQRASDNGVTVSIDFDGVTGGHMVHIDLSDNSDAGFYANGSRFAVRIEGVTVDGATLNVWIGAFSIGCTLRPTTAGRKVDVETTGEVGLNFDNIKNATGAHTLTNITVPVTTDVTNRVTADMTYIHGSALTETAGQLAGRFVNFFDQDSAGYNVKTPLSSFKATVLDAAGVRSAVGLASANLDTQLTALGEYVDCLPVSWVTVPTTAQIKTAIEAAGSHLTLIKAITDAIPDAGALSTIGTDTARLTAARAGALTDLIDGGRLDLLIDAILVDLADGTVQVGTVRDGAIGADAVADIFSTTAIAEAYAADGAAGTVAQLLYLILQGIGEFAITGTTKTVKKLDGSTTAGTYTLDSDSAPTSITRSG